MIRVFGQITDASGKGVPGAMIELRALKSTAEVLYGSVLPYKCDASGNYDFPLAIGAYDAYAQNDACGDMDYLGSAAVAANTTDGDLHHILVDGGINIIPPMLESAMEYTRRAEQAAAAAETDREQTGKDVAATTQNRQASETKAREAAESAGEAKTAHDSIVNDAADVRLKAVQVADNAVSVANNTTAVQRNTDQVAQNTQTVTTKAYQVSENAQAVAGNTLSVTQMRDEVVAKTGMAQGAADTATQKAASAAEHDASSAANAKIAQDSAAAVQGVLIDGGECDLSSGVYPPPQTVAGKNYSTVWYVKTGGTVSGVVYDAGDVLRYTTAKGGYYFRVDAVDTTTTQINAHAAKTGAHQISGVAGLTEALADKSSAQELSAAVAAHVAATNPHPQYSDFLCGEERDFATRKQLANRAAEYHPMDGQLVPRSTDAGLLAAIMAGEVPSCSDADWLANPENRGCYTLGDGSTTIRIADLNGKSSGSLGAPAIRGDGLNAAAAGKIQGDAIRNFTGAIRVVSSGQFYIGGEGWSGVLSSIGTGSTLDTVQGATFKQSTYGISIDASRQVPTGPENRMVNTAKVRAVKR